MTRKTTITLFDNNYEVPPIATTIIVIAAAPLAFFAFGVTFIAMLLSCSGGKCD